MEKTISFRVNQDLYKRVEKEAKAEDRDMSYIVRQALKDYFFHQDDIKQHLKELR